jgi:hypothetical protein
MARELRTPHTCPNGYCTAFLRYDRNYDEWYCPVCHWMIPCTDPDYPRPGARWESYVEKVHQE